MSFISKYWPHLLILVGAISTAVLLLFSTRDRRKPTEAPPVTFQVNEITPPNVTHSITDNQIRTSQNELRLLGIEREILSYAIRRIYEAEAEEKISSQERDRLATSYQQKMEEITRMISRSESIVALHDLETTQEDLLKLFRERFGDLSQKIEELRSHLEITPVQEVIHPSSLQLPSTPLEEEEQDASQSMPIPPKTEAEEKIEQLKMNIEKVLHRLEQIEIEG